jgi:hypothetical protein
MHARILPSLTLLAADWTGVTAADTRPARSISTIAPPMPRPQVAPPATIDPRPPVAALCAGSGGAAVSRAGTRRIARWCWSLLLAAAVLVGCASSPGPDTPDMGPVPPVLAPLTPPPHVEPGYQLARKDRPWEDATVIEYAADLGGARRFIAYYAFRGQQPPPGPPATVHLGCVFGTQPGGPTGRLGARLLATVDGVQLDFGPMDYQPAVGADAYWREGVPYTEAQRLAGTAVRLSCGDLEFALSPRQAQGLRRFFGREREDDR